MTEDSDNQQFSADDLYWTALPKYIAALNEAVTVSNRSGGHPAESARHYWASVLFTRLCSTAISVLNLCPGSPENSNGTHWDFSSLAPVIRSLALCGLMLFYLGIENVDEDESRARILVMQLRDCTERLRLFNSFNSDPEVRKYQLAAEGIRTELKSNPYFKSLPAKRRYGLLKGSIPNILTDKEILERSQIMDEAEQVFFQFVSSNADVSPLAYYRTGEKSRGKGEENDIDKGHIATSLEFGNDVLLRSIAGMKTLFQEAQVSAPPKSKSTNDRSAFERAMEEVLNWQGCNINSLTSGDDSETPLLCSDCFKDDGLRLNSTRIGQRDRSKCPNCGSREGKKLSRRSVGILTEQFFVWGTIKRFRYGACPAIQFNNRQTTSIKFAPWIDADIHLIEKNLQIGFFKYSPRLWMVGEVEPLRKLQNAHVRDLVISRILNEYPGRLLNIDEHFYRLRKAPSQPGDFQQYDSPPDGNLEKGRFDSVELPILYGSQDLEVCLHECRIAADDEAYIATLSPKRRLRLLNLADVLPEEHVTEFESLDMAMHMLFLAGEYSYEISREIARAAHRAGFDGIIYPSYFTLLRTGEIPFQTTFGLSHRSFPGFLERNNANTISNLALFGRPISDGLLAIRSINRVVLNKVEYNLIFGPLIRN